MSDKVIEPVNLSTYQPANLLTCQPVNLPTFQRNKDILCTFSVSMPITAARLPV